MGDAPMHLKALYYHCALHRIHVARRLLILEQKPINVTLKIHQWKLEVKHHLERIHKFGQLIPGKFQTRCTTIAEVQYIKYKANSKQLELLWKSKSPIDLNMDL
ncbi:hypothetical protein DSO57_1031138 [Entomophthora muscae]|uniref:Uncharacterized protein n=1 Tax=Entomophthora muscae TaxID=34485 RepID=A0ACC2T0S1_9FUNG|nr:hypothetical protein DSO57_1031138 [Entomophthora muscae]